MKVIRHWTTKSAYTSIEYRGVAPRTVSLTTNGIEVGTQRGTRENESLSTSMVSVPEIVGELQAVSQALDRRFVPLVAVNDIISGSALRHTSEAIDGKRANIRQWPDPPHVEFANCEFNQPRDVQRFAELYGISPEMASDDDPNESFMERLSAQLQTAETISVSLKQMQNLQRLVREHWGPGSGFKDRWQWRPSDIDFKSGKPRIVITDIWSYILVLFLIDLSAGRLKVCENPGCKQLKYFVKERRKQKYCSTPCRTMVNLKEWLAVRENRESWNADRKRARRKVKAGAK